MFKNKAQTLQPSCLLFYLTSLLILVGQSSRWTSKVPPGIMTWPWPNFFTIRFTLPLHLKRREPSTEKTVMRGPRLDFNAKFSSLVGALPSLTVTPGLLIGLGDLLFRLARFSGLGLQGKKVFIDKSFKKSMKHDTNCWNIWCRNKDANDFYFKHETAFIMFYISEC